MNNQRYHRSKRSSFVINLIETPNGFSIVQGTELLNKLENTQNIIQTLQNSGSLFNQLQITAPSKDYKPIFKKTNLVFYRSQQSATASSQTTTDKIDSSAVQICRLLAPWLHLEEVHEVEKKEIIKWVSEQLRRNIEEISQRQLEEWTQLYLKHRNFIISLYTKDYFPQKKYLSANLLRKYLNCQASWIMKIHLFLTQVGIINVHDNSCLGIQTSGGGHIFREGPKGKKELLAFELDLGIQECRLQEAPNTILKRLTGQLRPYCDYCRIHCGMVWFQHNRSLDPKQISNIMKNVNSKNPPLSQKQYQYVLCVRCYCENNFPLLLTHHDFKKISVNDRLEPNRRKKSKKSKKDKHKRDNDEQHDEEGKQHQEEERSHPVEQDQLQKQEQVEKIIQKLLNRAPEHQWTLEQTNYLLDLVEKHEEDWPKIHELMKKKGYCRSLDVEEIIVYFLSLPRRGATQLVEEYDESEFIEANLRQRLGASGNRVAERKLQDAAIFSQQISSERLKVLQQKASITNYPWKSKLHELIKLQMKKINIKLSHIQACENAVNEIVSAES